MFAVVVFKMHYLWFPLILALATPSAFAARSKHLARGPFLATCERALIATRLWKPTRQAGLEPSGASVESRGGQVFVKTADQTSPTVFNLTNNSLFEMRDFKLYPDSFLRVSAFEGKKVLDLACGEGALVEDLRRQGIEALGLDVNLNAYQQSKSYFVEASAEKTGLADQSFDLIMSTQGPLTYRFSDLEFSAKVWREIHRLLKTGGVVRISPVYDLESVGLMHLPQGLRVKSQPDLEWFLWARDYDSDRPAYHWLELERVD